MICSLHKLIKSLFFSLGIGISSRPCCGSTIAHGRGMLVLSSLRSISNSRPPYLFCTCECLGCYLLVGVTLLHSSRIAHPHYYWDNFFFTILWSLSKIFPYLKWMVSPCWHYYCCPLYERILVNTVIFYKQMCIIFICVRPFSRYL